MSDREEKLDALIQELAGSYNQPPEIPRDELWHRIASERSRLGERRPWRRVAWVVGLAATLVLGVAIGRLTVPGSGTHVVAGIDATGASATEGGEGVPVAYQLAAGEYLSRVEAFLSVFTVEAGQRNFAGEDVGPSARGLLRQTRLLRDSPAARDVALRALLDDVELVLVQISAFAQNHEKGDLGFIERGIVGRSVLLRLRSALPDRPVRPNTQGVL